MTLKIKEGIEKTLLFLPSIRAEGEGVRKKERRRGKKGRGKGEEEEEEEEKEEGQMASILASNYVHILFNLPGHDRGGTSGSL